VSGSNDIASHREIRDRSGLRIVRESGSVVGDYYHRFAKIIFPTDDIGFLL